MVQRKEWMRSASSGEGEILSRLWSTDDCKAIVQIAHGMAEHSLRYDAFATYLAERGFVVCMNDHAGHGPHAAAKGHFADADGWLHTVQDLKSLMDLVSEDKPGLPVFLLGHSMGSFLSRSYCIRHGDGLAGCVLMGTMGRNPALPVGRAVAALQKRVLGKRSRGKMLSRLTTGGYNRRIENPVNQNAWLSTVDAVAIAYDADPDCGFEFTAGGYYDLFTGLMEINDPAWAAAVPKQLPVFLLAGDADPVGDYGKGPKEVYDALLATDHTDVMLKLYPGKRHEMLNEANKDEVYADILAWLQAHMHSDKG